MIKLARTRERASSEVASFLTPLRARPHRLGDRKTMATPLHRSEHSGRPSFLITVALACVGAVPPIAAVGSARAESEVLYYSTAAPPVDYAGPAPSLASPDADEPRPAQAKVAEPAPTRVASAERNIPKAVRLPEPERPKSAAPAGAAALAEAKVRIASSAKTFATTKDYTCMFFKRERVGGQLTDMHAMHMKGRNQPHSIYFKFVSPNKGREAIYVAGGFGGKAVVHDVGIGKLIAGTLKLDPRGSMAMEDNRHPITEAGLGQLIETIVNAWDKELSPEESRVLIHPNARVGKRECVMIESIHPNKRPEFLYHMVKVYIDKENNLPIRFEAYDWPKGGKAPDLMEEYTYSDLRVNVGLTPRDFDPANKSYSFGRF